MGLIKKCPSCGEKLKNISLHFTGKIKCLSCDSWVKEDPRSTVWGSILLVVLGFLAASIDWKLLVFTSVFSTIIIFLNLEYMVVDEHDK